MRQIVCIKDLRKNPNKTAESRAEELDKLTYSGNYASGRDRGHDIQVQFEALYVEDVSAEEQDAIPDDGDVCDIEHFEYNLHFKILDYLVKSEDLDMLS